MVEARLVSIEELKKDNPTMCLSALRVFGRCNECPQYKKYKKGLKKKLDCEPKVNIAFLKNQILKDQIKKLRKQREQIEEEIRKKTWELVNGGE